MSSTTENLELVLPDATEFYDVEVLNKNMEKIDKAVGGGNASSTPIAFATLINVVGTNYKVWAYTQRARLTLTQEAGGREMTPINYVPWILTIISILVMMYLLQLLISLFLGKIGCFGLDRGVVFTRGVGREFHQSMLSDY